MSISMKNDVLKIFNLDGESTVSLKNLPGRNFGPGSSKDDIPPFNGGSLLNYVREPAADELFDEFFSSFNVTLPQRNVQRNVNMALAKRFNLSSSTEAIYEDLWTITAPAFRYRDDQKDLIHAQLANAYRFAAQVAADLPLTIPLPFGGSTTELPVGDAPTWSRRISRDDQDFVIFSDHHFTAFSTNSLDNYFLDRNLELYLDVLNHYADRSFCLVENGDQEECVIYDVSATDAVARKNARPGSFGGTGQFPIDSDDDDWSAYIGIRYGERHNNLSAIIPAFEAYYTLIRSRFAGKYVRLTGNHDTYLEDPLDSGLKDRVRPFLFGIDSDPNDPNTNINDILTIRRNGEIKYVVMHGHQFDTVSIQHSNPAFAKSLGEVFSELTSWIYQGPDRFWTHEDCKKWINGSPFDNTQAAETARLYGGNQELSGAATEAGLALLTKSRRDIKRATKAFAESLLGHEIGWEYFRNDDAYSALALEVIKGEQMFKFRHLNERELVREYADHFQTLTNDVGGTGQVPTLVLGHTHEPRQNSVNPATGAASHYLNSASAGRFENLIWCVEITGDTDRIVSWSRVNGRLKKITWQNVPSQQTVNVIGNQITIHSSELVHGPVDWFD